MTSMGHNLIESLSEILQIAMMSIMQFALLSWVLVVGAENEIDLLTQRKKIETNEPIKISSSKKFQV
uniref:Uncharacterized protein n=1 Tax=Wuchereria bancrofti TaxID=6293 RepID=A0A1I8F0I2_WUCBA